MQILLVEDDPGDAAIVERALAGVVADSARPPELLATMTPYLTEPVLLSGPRATTPKSLEETIPSKS